MVGGMSRLSRRPRTGVPSSSIGADRRERLDVERAVRSGLLAVWETQSIEPMVCLGCLKKLREEKAI